MAIKIFNKRYITSTVKVITRADLIHALDERYETIVVTGEIVKEVFDVMNDNILTGKRGVVNSVTGAIKNHELKGLLLPYRLVSIDDAKTEAKLGLLQSKRGFAKSKE